MRDRPAVPEPLLIAAALLVLVVAIGSVGYVVLEKWSLFDSFYMTVTTITTIGDGQPQPLNLAGKWWTIVVVVVGFAVLTYTVLALMAYVIEGQLGQAFETRRMRRWVAKMNGHIVLCGFGRVGREIAREFTEEKIDFVVVDSDEPSLARAAAAGAAIIHGNAADVETLKEAGIQRARCLVTAVDNDADNLFVTLSARVLKPDLFIVARANRGDAEQKLRLAGANRVVSPYTIGGRRLASLAMRPTSVEFVDTLLSASNGQLLLEDLKISSGARWANRALADLLPDADAAIVLAIKRGDAMIFRPPTSTVLLGGDDLVVAGPPISIRALERRVLERGD
jgi:voltage-gated potassium channel